MNFFRVCALSQFDMAVPAQAMKHGFNLRGDRCVSLVAVVAKPLACGVCVVVMADRTVVVNMIGVGKGNRQ